MKIPPNLIARTVFLFHWFEHRIASPPSGILSGVLFSSNPFQWISLGIERNNQHPHMEWGHIILALSKNDWENERPK
jgi:hypothetical protein